MRNGEKAAATIYVALLLHLAILQHLMMCVWLLIDIERSCVSLIANGAKDLQSKQKDRGQYKEIALKAELKIAYQ